MSTATRDTPLRAAPLTPAEERALLDDVCAGTPRQILVASDLHLGPGRDPVTGVYDVTENFFADESLERWLAHEAEDPAATLLVLNGDTFDFVRMTTVPRSRADFNAWAARLERLGDDERAARLRAIAEADDRERRHAAREIIARHEHRFGLRTDDYKTVWKLHCIARGHAPVLDALARFVGGGGRVVFTTGNHDVELYWPLVRQAVRDELLSRAERLLLLEPAGDEPERASRRITFADDGFTIANIYFEHGHRYEPMTAVVGPPVLKNDPTQITYPLGSFMNRYLINPIERLDPFLDNVKPVTGALVALLRRRPVRILGVYVRGWRFIGRALTMRRPAGTSGPVLTIAAALFVPPIALLLLGLYIAFPAWFAWIPRWLRISGTVAGISLPAILPFLIGLGGDLWRELRLALFGAKEDPLVTGARAAFRGAFAASPAESRQHATMGHTHQQTVAALDDRGSLYLNSGTWIPLWSVDRPDLAGQIRHSFVRFELAAEGEYVPASALWDDAAGAARPAVMLGAPL